jgi:hypothetical protein
MEKMRIVNVNRYLVSSLAMGLMNTDIEANTRTYFNKSKRAMKKQTVSMLALLSLAAGTLMTGCNPTVKIEAPEKPIVINLNIKIDHEIRIKVDRELDYLLENKQGLF